jgi:hypothetical protein
MFAAGMLASIAPVHAASAAFGQAVFTAANPEGTAGTITYSHSFTEPVLFVTESSTHGAHNVPVPESGASEPFGPDWGHITVKYLDPTTSTWKPAGEYTVPSSPVTPTPVQSATIVFEGDPGDATITLVSSGVSGLDGVGYFHIILNGDLSDPSIALPAGAGTFRFLTGLKAGDVIEVRVYGSGDGTGALLARAVVPGPPVDPTPTPTETTPLPDDTDRMIQICHATHPRAEAYESIEVSIAAILAGHGQHEGDIIPPFPYVKQGLAGGYPGNRWTEEGIAILNNGCTVIPNHTPTPTDTTTASPSPSTTETATANPSPSDTTSATSTPSSSSTGVAAPWTAKVTPSESETTATTKASRYPAALVDTAVKGGERQGGVSVLLFGGAAIAALIGFLLIRSGARESRRH